MPTLPLRQPSLESPEDHTVLRDRDSHHHPSHFSISLSPHIAQPFPERYNPGPIGRCSLPIQRSPARSVNDPTNTMVLGAENARFGHISPPAFATRNYSGIADTGYRKYRSLLCLCRSAHHPSPSPLCRSSDLLPRSTQHIKLIHTTQCSLPLVNHLLRPSLCFPATVRASRSMLDILHTTCHLSNTISRSLRKYQPGLVSLILPPNRLITLITDLQHQQQPKRRDFFLNLPVYVCTQSAEHAQHRLWPQHRR